ncbi:hypothetical protein [Micromonospora sp. NBC_01813]|uniref:hypothetical protein n=1 Tax=Micromonospora sp. NBC_01813 TaxID=2975988 RepID=UPI002DD983EF|nr:hypothetical protein [Micromonospora sp. NBC_01813]WSA08382.1 hypothetical protein OG958_30045 [Micromonospora sp. NBC_01813]
MRHVGSLVLSLVLAPVVWFLAGLGLSEYAAARREVYTQPPPEALIGLAALALCGVVYALLLLPRLSPIGPVLAGSSLLAMSVWSAVDMANFYASMPRRLFGIDFVFTAPAEGLAVVLAVPLLATVFSPRRWRGERMVALYAGAPVGPEVSRTAQLPMHEHGGYGGGYGDPGVYQGYGDPDRTIAFPAAAGPPARPPARPAAPSTSDTEHETMRLGPPGHRREDPTVVLPRPATAQAGPTAPGPADRTPAAPQQPSVAAEDQTVALPATAATRPTDETVTIGRPAADPDETTRITLPDAAADPDETTRITLPDAAADPDETTRITLPDETVRIDRPTTDDGAGDDTTTVVSAAPDAPKKSED